MFRFIFLYMDTLIIVLLPTVVVAAIIFFIYARKLSASHSAHRKSEMLALATRIKFDYSPTDNAGITKRVESEKTFFHSHNGEVENLITGKKSEIEIALFDYCYSDLQQRNTTVCMLTLPSKVSTFEIYPLDDSEISSGSSAEHGSKLLGEKHRFECEDRDFVEKAFNDDLIDFLSRRRRTVILGHEKTIIFHRHMLLSMRKCFGLLDFSFGFYSKLGLESDLSNNEDKEEKKGNKLDVEAEHFAE